jgi:hypothetical protein
MRNSGLPNGRFPDRFDGRDESKEVGLLLFNFDIEVAQKPPS